METRERIHQLVDELPETELDEVARLLESRRSSDPLSRALAFALPDDEAESDDEAEAVEQAYLDVRQGKLVSHGEVLRQLTSPAKPG
ncbi:MAG TPA: hypothetical protein VH482_09465 [Thermomicrobiales bacterium]|jgi:hypothetical protein